MTTLRPSPEHPAPTEPRRPSVGVVAVGAEGLVRHLDAAAETITGWTLRARLPGLQLLVMSG
jgi:hypothetical protein